MPVWHRRLVAKERLPECRHLLRTVARAPTGLKHHQAGRLCRHECPELVARQLLSERHLTGHLRLVELKNTLCQIHTNQHIIHLAVLLFAWR